MLVPSWAPSPRRLTLPLPNGRGRVGTVAAIYGANASGKSNVLKALSAMAEAVEFSHQQWSPDGGAPYDPFVFDEEHRGMPTSFDVELLLDAERWQYGFALDKAGVVDEWLYAYPRGRRRVWFERSRSEGFYIGKSLLGPVTTLQSLTRSNSLFLSVGAANNHPGMSRVARWFSNHLMSCSGADERVRIQATADQLADDGLGPQIQALLSLADLGVVRAEPQPRSMDLDMRTKMFQTLEIFAPGRFHEDDDIFANANLPTEVTLYHRATNGPVALPLTEESRGTQAWFGLVGPVVTALASGDLLLVDEIDSSLHPLVTARLVQLFRDSQTNSHGAQLIFTSHDTSLLGSNFASSPIDRDELWLTDKPIDGATTLYPLTDFHPRKSENLERGYLKGRYGGIPTLQEDSLTNGKE